MLQSEVDTLNASITFMSVGQDNANEAVNALSKKVQDTAQKRDNATQALIKARADCIQHNAQEGTSETANSPCDDLKKSTESTVDATFQNAQASSEFFSSSFLLNSNNKYTNFLSARIDALEREIGEIKTQLDDLKSSQVYLGGIADSDEFNALNRQGNETVQDYDSEWMQFEYDSDSSHIHTDQDKRTTSVAAGIGVGVQGASLDASGHYSKGTADLKQALNSASLKVSGELLRVTIKRPWFRPSLFENPLLYFVSCTIAGYILYIAGKFGWELNFCCNAHQFWLQLCRFKLMIIQQKAPTSLHHRVMKRTYVITSMVMQVTSTYCQSM